MTELAVLLAAGAALGVILAIRGLTPTARRSIAAPPRMDMTAREFAIAAVVGALAGLLTGWPVAAALFAGAAVAAPRFFTSRQRVANATRRVEAVAGWTELLRDTLVASAGLESAIVASAPLAPAAIRNEVGSLARRLRHGALVPAMRRYAAEVSDPTNDLVVAALILASERQTSQLSVVLSELSQVAREDAAARLRAEAARARTRTSVRVIIATTALMAGGLLLFNREYLSPFGTAAGQVMLLLTGALFAAAFAWLARMGKYEDAPRILGGVEVVRS